jgi:NNP family nitrate/nitrite transporter-like MFS transporter
METSPPGRASRIRLSDVRSVPMRAFHLTWSSFFVCFFAWFGVAPLMAVVRKDLELSAVQVGNTMIASVAATIAARILIGWLLDRFGPRRCYAGLLIFGAVPVAAIGLAQSYETFLLLRLAIGVVGASFVITQYHTSVMFAPNVVGTANALAAGWGNLGGGVTQMAMPLVLASLVGLGLSEGSAWRVAMLLPAAAMVACGIAYHRWAKDFPGGNLEDLRREGRAPPAASRGGFGEALKDYRVWILALAYAACFGVELTVNNVAALYFKDSFALGVTAAGLLAGLFGLTNIFARALGGWLGDLWGLRLGLAGRVRWLGAVLLLEGISAVLFSRASSLGLAVGAMLAFSVLVGMGCGATYAVVPFVNRRALGAVAGLVGAGGNVGAVLSGLLFRGGLEYGQAFLILGVVVSAASGLVFLVQFSSVAEREESEALVRALDLRRALESD